MSLPSDFDKTDDVANFNVKSRWEQRKRLQRKFFLRFKDEYLLHLSKLQTKQTKNVAIKEGDVVLPIDEDRSRGSFHIARVVKTYIGSDGVCRGFDLRLPIKVKGTKKTKKPDTKNAVNKLNFYPSKAKIIHRGVEKLALLEETPSVNTEPENENEELLSGGSSGTVPSVDHGGGRC